METALMLALTTLSFKGEAGIAIIQQIVDKFLDRPELFHVNKYGQTALTIALKNLSYKGEAGIAIIQQIVDKFLEQNRRAFSSK